MGCFLGTTFDGQVPVLYGLKIPQFLRNVTVCDVACRARQRMALSAFYENTNGPRWLKRNKWNSSASICEWEGILCYSRTNHVIAIQLEGNNGMNGHIGKTLGQLPYIFGVNMGGSGLQGNVGRLLETFKDFFIRFDFASNKLHGEVPKSIQKWRQLGKIQLSGNRNITGVFPKSICQLTDLQVLSLGETSISGSIPRCIANLTNLYFLDLETLSLTGKLESLKGLSSLAWLHLMSNKIDGEIPGDMGNWFPELKELVLQGNRIAGEIPRSLGNLSKLSLLQLSGNEMLTGYVPLSFSRLTKLTILDISYTGILGFETGLVLQAGRLSSFVAKGNKKFSMTIYRLVEALGKSRSSLIQLDMGDCDIYGKFNKYDDDTNLVNGIFQFSKLGFLNLGGNTGLYGTVPDPIGSVGLLMFLNVSNTNLSSGLPLDKLIKLKLLQQIDARGNPLMKGEVNKYFIDIDYSLMAEAKKGDTFTCPAFRLKNNISTILIDALYYDRRYCQCKQGYYGLGGYCRRCIKGGTCNGSMTKVFSANDYLLTKMELSRGFWPFPHRHNVSSILACRWTPPGKEICNPNRSVYCVLKKSNYHLVTVCSGNICKQGSKGRLCSQCEEGYFESERQCHPCPTRKDEKNFIAIIISTALIIIFVGSSLVLFSSGRKVPAAVFAIVQAVVTFILASLGIIPSWLAQVNIVIFLVTIAGFGKHCKGLMKTIVFYVQIIDSLITSVHIWPASFYSFSDYLSSIVNLRFAVLKCKQPGVFNPAYRLAFLMALPAVASVLLTVTGSVVCKVARRKWPAISSRVKYNFSSIIIMFLNLSYFPIVSATASILVPCRDVQGQVFMSSFPWVDCTSEQHKALMGLAYTSLLIYVVGIPLLFLVLLIWKREKIVQEDEMTKQWLGSLFMPYKAKHRVFLEVTLMMRRTAIAFLSAFFAEDASMQIALISVVFLIYLTFESQERPLLPSKHKVSCDKTAGNCTCLGLENLLELAMLVILFLTFLVAKTSMLERKLSVPLLWVIGMGNIAFGIVLAISFVSRMLKREGETRVPTEGMRLLQEDGSCVVYGD